MGFIGSHIVDNLITDNKIIIIDDESNGKIENLSYPKSKNLTLIKKDINDIDCYEILDGVNYVFHLAGMTSVPLSIKYPLKCYNNNLNATIKLLEGCRYNNIEKIVFSSSSAVYGYNDNIPLKENEYPIPISPYASSKICSEMYMKMYYETYGLNYVCLRYFNVFGERQNINSAYSAVIPNFIKKILNNEKPTIYGDGCQTRDFVYVDDVVNANLQSIRSNYNGVVNVASGKGRTIQEIYDMVSKYLNYDGGVNYLPYRKGEIKHSVGSISNMEKINLKIDSSKFEEHLRKTIEWIRKELV